MKLKRLYNKTKASLTSEQAKKNYSNLKKIGYAVGQHSRRLNTNLDETFSIPRKYPDRTLSNLNRSNSGYVPKGYKLVKKKKRR